MDKRLIPILFTMLLTPILAGCTTTRDNGTWDGEGWDNALVNCHTHTDHSIDGQWTLDEAMTWSDMCETEVDPFTWEEVKALGADGIEGWNGGFEEYYTPEISNATGMIITTGTDAHAAWSGNYATYFTMEYTRLTVRTENPDEIMSAIANGQSEIYPEI